MAVTGFSEPPPPANKTQRILAVLIDAALLLIIANALFGLLALLLIALEVTGEQNAAFDIAAARQGIFTMNYPQSKNTRRRDACDYRNDRTGFGPFCHDQF